VQLNDKPLSPRISAKYSTSIIQITLLHADPSGTVAVGSSPSSLKAKKFFYQTFGDSHVKKQAFSQRLAKKSGRQI
jgi:hypothetical protein